MKYIRYILVGFILSLFLLGGNYAYADVPTPDDYDNSIPEGTGGNTTADTSKYIEVLVTEEMPGLDCVAELHPSDETGEAKTGRYTCKVPIGMNGVLLLVGRMIRWLTGVAMLSAVLFLVFNGIRLSTAGLDGEAKGKVKSQIFMTLGGIVLLLLSGPFLKLLAPWIYR